MMPVIRNRYLHPYTIFQSASLMQSSIKGMCCCTAFFYCSCLYFCVDVCYIILLRSHIVADPTLIEEETAEASLNVGMNAYRELCGIHLGGKALSDYNSVLKVVQRAGAAAAEIVQFIKQSLADDEKARWGIQIALVASDFTFPRKPHITTILVLGSTMRALDYQLV